MKSYEKIIGNFEAMLGQEVNGEPLFRPATTQQLEKLKQLVGYSATVFMDFYKEYQPCNKFPALDCYVNLLDIESILDENINLAPGIDLSPFGVFVFATTTGGNVICIDTNDCKNGDPAVLIASCDFCFYNEEKQYIEIADAPDDVMDEYKDDEPIILNYTNIKKCMPRIEKSFLKFMDKLSRNCYDDIEEYLDFD